MDTISAGAYRKLNLILQKFTTFLKNHQRTSATPQMPKLIMPSLDFLFPPDLATLI